MVVVWDEPMGALFQCLICLVAMTGDEIDKENDDGPLIL
jgi:hypothetical protein